VGGGQFFELRHRVLGALIGVAALLIVFAAWKREKRPWVRKMSYWLLLLVVVQGVLGGLRVHAISSPSFREVMDQFFSFLGKMDPGTAGRIAFAMIHALMAQITLLLFFALAIMTGKTWWSLRASEKRPQLIKLGRFAWASTILLFFQLLLGAFVRHATFPVALEPVTTILVLHILLAIGIAAMVTFTLFHVARSFWEESLLRKPMTLAVFCLFLQLLLGVGAWLSVEAYGTHSDLIGIPILIRGAHLLNAGILLLALSQLALRANRMAKLQSEPKNFLNLEAGQG
jgi:cytochrome c oxidase assembly protein subunit 15